MTVIPEGTGLMKPCPNNGSDLISRSDAIEAVRKLKIVEDNKNFPDYAYNAGIETAIKTIEVMLSADAEEYIKECNTKTHDLVHRDVIKPKLVDCTDFVNWLIEEVMDDEMWELNAVANGEIIARKMAKLGLLEVLDGYYIRTPNKPQSVVAEIKIDTDEIVSKAISALSAEAVHKPDYSYEADMVRRLKETLSAEAPKPTGELIARADAIDAIDDAIDADSPQWAILRTRIGFLPSAEAVQGEWVLVKGSNGKDYHKCSKCLHTQEITGVKNYCAVCGARMKGGDDE